MVDIVRQSSHSLAASEGSLSGNADATPKGYDDLNFHSVVRPVSRDRRESLKF